MSISLNTIKCPECGAGLSIEEGRAQCFCSYCGSKIIVTNDNEYVYRHIDEASVKKAETDRIVELKKIEMAEQDRALAQKTRKIKFMILISIFFALAISYALTSVLSWIYLVGLIIEVFLIFDLCLYK